MLSVVGVSFSLPLKASVTAPEQTALLAGRRRTSCEPLRLAARRPLVELVKVHVAALECWVAVDLC